MSSLSKQQVKIIVTAIKKQAPRIRATTAWVQLSEEYGLGEQRGDHIHFSRQDYKAWREILIAECGFDPVEAELTGNRTEVARLTSNEKWSTESVRAGLVSVTVLGGNLVTAQGQCDVIPGVEYRVSIDALRPDDYEALLVVENFEAFLFIHQYLLPECGHALVLYRGHDASARSVIELQKRADDDMPVIGFADTDPAGIGIVIDNRCLTHALFPDRDSLVGVPTLAQRFADQLTMRPRLLEQCSDKSEEFRQYVKWMLIEGIAISQERMCSLRIPFQLVAL